MARPSLPKLSKIQWGLACAFIFSIFFLISAALPFFTSHYASTQQALDQGSYTRLIIATGEIEGKPKPPGIAKVEPTKVVEPEKPLPSVEKAPVATPPAQPAVTPETPAAVITPEHKESPNAPAPAPVTPTPETPPATPATAPTAETTPVTPAPQNAPMMSAEEKAPAPEPAPPAAGQPLVIKTNPALQEVINGKKIPRKSEDGTLPCEYYARPDATPRDVSVIALLVTGLGINTPLSNAAINNLPPEVSLSFSPYSTELQEWIARSNRYGHEAWLDVPMEFADYPASDPGPLGLLKKATEEENLNRLRDTLATASGYVGLVAPKDEIFTGYKMMEMMHHEVAERGLLMLLRSRAYKAQSDASSVLYSSRALLREKSRAETTTSLKDLETIAKDYGFAVGVIDASPANFETVGAWAKQLAAHNMKLIPLSAIPSRHR